MVLSPVRLGLSTLVALTCLVSSPLTGVTQPQKPAPPSGPAAPIPGGPKVVQLPDLVISKLTSTKGFGCGPTGYTIELTVTVKNMGAAPAIKPAGGAYWAGIGVNEAGPWPKEQSLLGGPAQLAPGQSVTLKGVVTAHVYHPSPYVGDKGVYYRTTRRRIRRASSRRSTSRTISRSTSSTRALPVRGARASLPGSLAEGARIAYTPAAPPL